MLHKFFQSKIVKWSGCIILAVVIYYSMTDGFTRTVGEVARVGGNASVEKSMTGSSAEWVVIGLLVLWILIILGKHLWEKHRRPPKNDVNVRY